jgi:hypothetical protein
MKAFKPPSPPYRGGARRCQMKLIEMISEWVSEWVFFRRLGKCFRKIKREHHELGFYRFYLVVKCPDLLSINPDVDLLVFLFHLHNSTIDFDDYAVKCLRSLRA